MIQKAGADGNRSDSRNDGAVNDLQESDFLSAAQSGAIGDVNEVLSIRDDPRLLALTDAWPMLSDEASDAIVRLTGCDPDHLRNSTAAPHGKGGVAMKPARKKAKPPKLATLPDVVGVEAAASVRLF